MEEKNHIYPILLSHWSVNFISEDCFAVSLTGIIFVVVSIITSDFPKLTGWRISVA